MVALRLGGKGAGTRTPHFSLLSHPAPCWCLLRAGPRGKPESREHIQGLSTKFPYSGNSRGEEATNQFCIMIAWRGSVMSADSGAAPGRFQFGRLGVSPEKPQLYKALWWGCCSARMDNPFSSHSDALVNECYRLDLTSLCSLNPDITVIAGNAVYVSIYSTNIC